MADDILCSFLIGHTEYDMDFKPYEPGSETYNLENGIVLHNQMENGNYYIADSDGNPYLTAQEFFEHNHITDAILSEDGTRFCDLQGNILYPEWDYNYVSLVTDQYEIQDSLASLGAGFGSALADIMRSVYQMGD